MGVEIVALGKARKVAVRGIKEKARKILGLLNRSKTELSLALVGNREIQELNAKYRLKNEPTDVLSFPIGEHLPPEEDILGDVVISVEQAEKQARTGKRTVEAELETLLIHGILHLLGYDHERSARDAKLMGRMERKINRALCETKG
jgi:rRNA maturation RNase YbeY